ncbi:hypothetical protein IWW55_000841 [Coemansia sp. RSA 2706]|nr:hypothetical protein IWW55_000841 [Coemansia sp. RSA 2706]KAJ2312935.1 hypothetical protein IWW54_001795 [Coemansia sp. RSA 2705]KAJ2320822.1 hypothetical protein IWW52_001124 [Coemansia sp. RSA 2704]KAJ2368303.1 hypothetical protein H4S01_001665 [Coemansia sp. RSA 2610]KAJ2390924.1 hypothetical protein H4S02_001597 [Coemansia sp. RSA 2611]KAJ2738573.1 hypothetical protein H4R23_001054 [Coemansia sp. Cherry 401B]
MDIVPLVSTIAACVEPGSSNRQSLQQHLARLVSAVHELKTSNVEANSLLSHITLVAARLLTRLVELHDRERELVLECVEQALTPDERKHSRLRDVHAVIIDHLSRILVPLFVLDGTKATDRLPESTRMLAIRCWRQLAVCIASVYVPQNHPSRGTVGNRVLPCTMLLREYMAEYLPADYAPLAVCALLDNAETADDQQLRLYALETLAKTMQRGGLLDDRDLILGMFPGTASALTRIAVAQLTAQARDAATRKPIATVRAQALKALEAAISVVYSGQPGLTASETIAATAAEEWAEQARVGFKSIVDRDGADKENTTDEANGAKSSDHERIQQILWRLAGLRHIESIQPAVFALFARVSSQECISAGMPEGCVRIAIETCLAIAGARPDMAADYVSDLASRCASADERAGYCVAAILDSMMSQFERFVVDGEPQQRADVLCVVAGCIGVLGQARAMPVVAAWWQTRGLQVLLASLSVSLPGTSLLITEPSESTGALASSSTTTAEVSYVLDRYRGAELEQSLDLFVRQISELLGARELGAQLLSLLFGSSDMQVSVLWLLRRVAGLARGNELSSVCPSAFQYCVDFCNSAREDSAEDEPQRVVHELMVLDVVSTLVPAIGPGVAYYMDTLLFPLLQMTTATSPVLRAQARRALSVLAQQQASGDVARMLQDNVDYIVEGCSQQIRSVALHPRVFGILSGAVQLVGRDILVYMDDVVEDTLDACERLVYEEDDEEVVLGALQFLEIVTRTVAADNDSRAIEEKPRLDVAVPDPDPIGSAIKELEDADAARMLDELVLADSLGAQPIDAEDEQKQQEEADDGGGPAGSPLAIKIVLSIQSFLYAESSAAQLLALNTVRNACSALRSTRDLLPLLNEVWPSLVNRLDTRRQERDAFYVTLAACDVIERVCVLGAAWMRKRVKDDLWVHFGRILRESPLSMQRSEGELVRRVLRTMSRVVESVPLDDRTAWELCVSAMRFFGGEAEAAAIELLQAMVPVYGDKLWLVLAKLGCVEGVDAESIVDIGVPDSIRPPAGICGTLGL